MTHTRTWLYKKLRTKYCKISDSEPQPTGLDMPVTAHRLLLLILIQPIAIGFGLTHLNILAHEHTANLSYIHSGILLAICDP